ncbi:glycosyltransferase [Maribacter sp. 2307ULW6-5]|uniref:glycosyltransferase n=1 Tax=Maribacter sp. 2307ULW6-5 TaxID=3386275 RepID=UPI0039BD4E1C
MPEFLPAIVVVAYNRPRSLQRLLTSINKAHFPNQDIPLIISIDRATDNQAVLALAQAHPWPHGEKKVLYQEANLGLRKHVLQCGDLTRAHGSIIMLEDDLYVSPLFYEYAVQALNFSADDLRIGGVSLYNHQLNVHARKNFAPLEDGYDNWYFQFASSWGQAWTEDQWSRFRNWYAEDHHLAANAAIPQNVRDWSEKSWLKYFIAFLIETDRYFLYPKISLTSNFSDTGTHVGEDSTAFQLPLLYAHKKQYHFSPLSKSGAVYDAFFENTALADHLGLERKALCVDLYKYRSPSELKGYPYVLTGQQLPYQVLKTFGRSLKPMDANILEDIEGNDLALYSTESPGPGHAMEHNRFRELSYHLKEVKRNEAFILWKHLAKRRAKHLWKKLTGLK